MERDLAGMGFAGGGEHLDPAAVASVDGLAHDAALADTGWPDHPDHTPGTADRLIEDAGDGVHLPGAPDQGRLVPAMRPALSRSQQPTRGNGLLGALDVHPLGRPEHGGVSRPDRAVDSLSITPPGGATDSIRCAIPTCSPIAV